MKVLVVGSGGREHALCWKLKQSRKLEKLYCAPGNAGISSIASCVPEPADDIRKLCDFVKTEEIDLTVVGPEVPLTKGIVDLFQSEGLRIFGPSKEAAQLEGSKAYAKRFMRRYGIPTASFMVCDDLAQALLALKSFNYPLVVKASGLAAGKGVIICTTPQEAELTVKEIMVEGRFGEAGSSVVIEEYLEGEEVSILALTDGLKYACLTPSQDHKRLEDNDQGPNTGGMGAYAPAPLVTPVLQGQIEAEILRPTLAGLRSEGVNFTGCLYSGLIITADGPKVLEYNVRFGDPEAQVVLQLLKSDFLEVIESILDGNFSTNQVQLHSGSAACVVMASGGYPEEYEKGKQISGLDKVPEGITVFHAGTASTGDGVITDGGRVLGVTARGKTLREALDLAYKGVGAIDFEGKFYRHDIGHRALKMRS